MTTTIGMINGGKTNSQHYQLHELVQERRNSSALAMELHLSNPSSCNDFKHDFVEINSILKSAQKTNNISIYAFTTLYGAARNIS